MLLAHNAHQLQQLIVFASKGYNLPPKKKRPKTNKTMNRGGGVKCYNIAL